MIERLSVNEVFAFARDYLNIFTKDNILSQSARYIKDRETNSRIDGMQLEITYGNWMDTRTVYLDFTDSSIIKKDKKDEENGVHLETDKEIYKLYQNMIKGNSDEYTL